MKCIAELWCDESATIISVELVLVLTIMCTGLVVGLTATRDAVVTELADIGAGIASLNQSFSYCGVSSGSAQFSGSLFLDGLDIGDDICSQTANANSRGLLICASQAVHEGQN
jgi:hypothetical protein